MPKVSFKNKTICIEVEVGTTIAVCIRKAGLYIETPCSCIRVCGKCRVKAEGALFPPSYTERGFLNENEPDIRIACLAKVNGDVDIQFIEKGGTTNSAIASKEKRRL